MKSFPAGFDNFIMTSRACFVVITGCPQLWLDLYCDRHLTPRTTSLHRLHQSTSGKYFMSDCLTQLFLSPVKPMTTSSELSNS